LTIELPVYRMQPNDSGQLVRITDSQECCSSPWENAYLRFETLEEEIEKFMRRQVEAKIPSGVNAQSDRQGKSV
jgi:hypothetical protein